MKWNTDRSRYTPRLYGTEDSRVKSSDEIPNPSNLARQKLSGIPLIELGSGLDGAIREYTMPDVDSKVRVIGGASAFFAMKAKCLEYTGLDVETNEYDGNYLGFISRMVQTDALSHLEDLPPNCANVVACGLFNEIIDTDMEDYRGKLLNEVQRVTKNLFFGVGGFNVTSVPNDYTRHLFGQDVRNYLFSNPPKDALGGMCFLFEK